MAGVSKPKAGLAAGVGVEGLEERAGDEKQTEHPGLCENGLNSFREGIDRIVLVACRVEGAQDSGLILKGSVFRNTHSQSLRKRTCVVGGVKFGDSC